MSRTRIAVLIAVVVALFVPDGPVAGAPDDEGSTGSARKKLAQAARDYNNAKAQLAASTKRRAELDRELARGARRLVTLRDSVAAIADTWYRQSPSRVLLGRVLAGDATDVLQAADTLRYLGLRDARQVRELRVAARRQTAQRAELAGTIATQRRQVAKLKKRKAEAQAAVDAVSSGASSGFSGGSATADPVPRNADGSLPDESCSEDDPTTDGCLTPRTLHDYHEARQAGFTRYTACWREESSGEHPLGRACDFSVTPDGFEGQATGAAKDYGDHLAAWFVANADALAVLYVIWYRQIWLPGTGWSSYDGSGSPSAEHTNHVHLSVQ
jgi:peptidoglycan DL-endopeptidase CwlO